MSFLPPMHVKTYFLIMKSKITLSFNYLKVTKFNSHSDRKRQIVLQSIFGGKVHILRKGCFITTQTITIRLLLYR